MQEIRIYNTLSGTKETFTPRQPGKVGMYCCGPTTYNLIHVGNARPLVVFDTVRRYFLYRGYEVDYIVNFTDVDDKIINRAKAEGEEPLALASRYVEEYFQDADALGAMRATVYPRVSRHLPEIIAFVAALVDKGLAYSLDGDVYYSVAKFQEYGKLSKRKTEDLLEGARVDVDQRKENPADFALWKKAKSGEPAWDSPWGPGRPGWHIECSAMSYKYLGGGFDIHGGGADLIFPHHENEIAQSEGRFGDSMARYWMHNGFITINQEKMSKSLGNFFLVREVLEKFSGQVIRFYLLSVHYRSPLDFDDEKLEAARKGLERLNTAWRLGREALGRLQGQEDTGGAIAMAAAPVGGRAAALPDSAEDGQAPGDQGFAAAIDKAKDEFEAAMNDDFNTALAIAALFDLARSINSYLGSGAPQAALLEQALGQFQGLADVLGLTLADTAAREASDSDGALVAGLTALLRDLHQPIGEDRQGGLEAPMAALLALRQSSRQAKDFATADRIRNGLKDLGIVVEDTAQGPRWHRG